ncbi:ATP-binding protein [Ilumatobacter sp.]|uniref:ATP-binding protein n=1 Tax=Ilumatobacter sp. TaxID=1967498 RepID=UPI003AF9E564
MSVVRRCFLFSDIVDSTANWEADSTGMAISLRRHDQIVRDCIERHGGVVMSNPGDGFGAAFDDDASAVLAGRAVQDALAAVDWSGGPALGVRVGMESGEAEFRDGNYFGPTVNRAARVSDAGHGGQVLVGPNVATPDIMMRSLGEYRLKGVAEPVAIRQVGAVEFGRLRALDSRRSNLPQPPNELVGREQEQERVRSMLDQSRLVTVSGMGGVGKTRLTQAVAESMLGRFDDGVWFAELASCRDLRSIISATANALGVPVPDDAARLGEIVRGHALLLVLDNCEHVADDVRHLCESLVATSARLKILTSSRERLGVANEAVYPLMPLASRRDAGTVFRHRAASAGVDVEALDPMVYDEICDRLDRIPLAIELAAATCRVLSPEQILERLDQRFQLLRGDARTSSRGRHETLRSAIDWSYESLEEHQQRLFRRLSVFNGGFTIEAAEHVAADIAEPTIFVLTDLVDRSLLTVASGPGRSRYFQLETIRAYARERSDELGETDGWVDRHIDWCHRHVADMAAIATGATEASAIDRIVAERDNLRAAISRLRRLGRSAEAADLVRGLEDLAYAANPIAELVQPLVEDGTVDAHPERRRLLGVELIRRSTADGTEGRAELAADLLSSLSIDDPGSLQIPVMLIANALQQPDDTSTLDQLVARARAETDGAERARLLVAALLGTFFVRGLPKPPEQVTEAIDAAETAEMTRLLIPIGAAACMGGLTSGDVAGVVATVRPLLDHLLELPTPSIMASGLVVTYTEAAVQAGATAGDRVAAIRHLGPVLKGDFNRLGLALARLVQYEGDHDVAVRAVGACSRTGRSNFSERQIEAIIGAARDAFGSGRVEQLLAEGADRERSDLYRTMWDQLQPALTADD